MIPFIAVWLLWLVDCISDLHSTKTESLSATLRRNDIFSLSGVSTFFRTQPDVTLSRAQLLCSWLVINRICLAIYRPEVLIAILERVEMIFS